jgi:hypothetical protein
VRIYRWFKLQGEDWWIPAGLLVMGLIVAVWLVVAVVAILGVGW